MFVIFAFEIKHSPEAATKCMSLMGEHVVHSTSREMS